jgi:hypothetical protein
MLLHGCSSDFPEPSFVPATSNAGTLAPDGAHCRAVARERADDALANGYGFGIEESVYQETYDDCLTWRRRDQLK